MLSLWVSLLLLMVALAMAIKTANSQPPMKLEVSVKKSNTSGYNTIDQETIKLARARPGEQAGGDARARLPIAALLPIPAALGCLG